jgi:hypothetical protein
MKKIVRKENGIESSKEKIFYKNVNKVSAIRMLIFYFI